VDWDELNVIAAYATWKWKKNGSWMWCCTVWWKFTTILTEPIAAIFVVEQYSSSLKGREISSTLHGA